MIEDTSKKDEILVMAVDSSGSAAITREAAPTHKVLRDTYRLLSMTLAFSAIMASAAIALDAPRPGLLITLGGYFGLLYITAKLKNSYWGLLSAFGLTGFMGFTLGPMIGAYLTLGNGPALVATSLAATAAVFVGLSIYARGEKAVNVLARGNLLLTGIIVAFVLGLTAVIFALPALGLAVSALFVLLMSGLIIYETQNIVSGGETNYIMATVTLFVAIYNLFTSLLHLLGFAGGEEG